MTANGSSHKIAAYGTLKKGCYNYYANEMRFLKETKLKGYDMYDLGFYPGCVRGEGEIVVHLLEVDDFTYNRINRMERGAGYSPVLINVDEHKDVTFYLYRLDVSEFDKIESGNWKDK